MPKHNPSGPPKGRRSSSRSNASGKSFSKKSDTPPFKKSSGPDSSKSSFSKGGKFSDSPRGSGFSRSSKKDSSYKSSAPGGKPDRDNFSENTGRRPFKKFDKDQKPRANERRSSFPGGGKEERPFKKFDKPAGKSPFRKASSEEERPYKKINSPDAVKPDFDRGGKPSFKKRDSSAGGERPYKKFDRNAAGGERPFTKKNERSSGGDDVKGSRPPYKKFDRDSSERSSAPRSYGSESTRRPFKKRESSYENKKFTSDKRKPNPQVDSKPSDGKIRLNKFIANSGGVSDFLLKDLPDAFDREEDLRPFGGPDGLCLGIRFVYFWIFTNGIYFTDKILWQR
jgi:23S rRNA pseudouridine2605 synthase